MSTEPGVRIRVSRRKHGEGLPVPAPATVGSAGADLAAAIDEEVVIAPGERVRIPTGFAFAIPEGFEAQLRPRSGLALEHGLVLPNAPGTIDSDYRGEVKVVLTNASADVHVIEPGTRIAQMVVLSHAAPEVVEVEALDDTERGAGGFGSTGTT